MIAIETIIISTNTYNRDIYVEDTYKRNDPRWSKQNP